MGTVSFYKLTEAEYHSLESPDPDAVYLTSDTHRIYLGSVNYAQGIGSSGETHVIGGYTAKISAYSNKNSVYLVTLAAMKDTELDMTKFAVGKKIRFNNSEDDPDSEDESVLRWQERTILTVDAENSQITIDADLLSSGQSSLDYETAVCMVKDETRSDTPTSLGAFDFVTGYRSTSDGSWNTVTGMCAHAHGMTNFSTGDASLTEGIGNQASGSCCHAEGIKNTASGLFAHAEGSTNKASGDMSHAEGGMTTASGDHSHAEGNSTKAMGRNSHVGGASSEANGDYSFAHGYSVIANAKQSTIFGAHGTLNKSPENEAAFAIAGGEKDAPALPFIFRSRKKALNPEYDSAKDPQATGMDSDGNAQYISRPACSFTFLGRIVPETKTISDSVAVLDHDKFARWCFSATPTEIQLQNWNDGDYGEVVIHEIPPIPEDWIECDFESVSPPINIMQIEKLGEYIFCRLKF